MTINRRALRRLSFCLWLATAIAAQGIGIASGISDSQQYLLDKKSPSPAELKAQEEKHRLIQRAQERSREDKLKRTYDLLRIRMEPEACVAFRKDNFGCLVDVSTFNRVLESLDPLPDSLLGEIPPPPGNIAERRMQAIEPLLERAFLHHLRERSEGRPDARSRTRDRIVERIGKLGSHLPDSILLNLYRANAGHFRGGAEFRLEILAATDSLLIDSLLAALTGKSVPAGGKAALGSRKYQPSVLTLRRIGVDSLEPAGFAALLPIAAQAPLNTWIRPAPGRFGHYLINLRSKVIIPPVPFERALPVLAYLASSPPLPAPDSGALEEEMKAYYAANLEYFQVPDTLLLDTWLWPAKARTRKSGFAQGGKPEWETDTARYRPKSLTQFDLPSPVGNRVYQDLRCCRGDVWGPLATPFGLWTFRLQGVRKGRGYRPYTAVRDSLLRIRLSTHTSIHAAKSAIQSKVEDAELAAWREKALEDLRIMPHEAQAIEDSLRSLPAYRDQKEAELKESARFIGAYEIPAQRLRRKLQIWISESVDLTTLDE